MTVHYNIVNKILVDCGIAEINPNHNEGKEESQQIWLIPNQAYRLIIMDKTRIVADQIKDTDQSKEVCVKGEGGRSTTKYEKETKGGVLLSVAGSNWGMTPRDRPCSCLPGKSPHLCLGRCCG